MSEYIEKAAAVKAVLRERKPTNSVAQNRMLSIIQRDLLTMPAADVAPVVRCEKCEYVRAKVNIHTGEQVGVWCCLWDEIDIGADDYCSRGKPREAVT